MTKTRHVCFEEVMFSAYDVALGIWLKHFVELFELTDLRTDEWWIEKADWWRVVAAVDPYGIDFDEGWTPELREQFVTLAESVNAKLAERTEIPASEVASWDLGDGLTIWPRCALTESISTAPVIELGVAMIDLVQRILPATPVPGWWFVGTGPMRVFSPPSKIDTIVSAG